MKSNELTGDYSVGEGRKAIFEKLLADSRAIVEVYDAGKVCDKSMHHDSSAEDDDTSAAEKLSVSVSLQLVVLHRMLPPVNARTWTMMKFMLLRTLLYMNQPVLPSLSPGRIMIYMSIGK